MDIEQQLERNERVHHIENMTKYNTNGELNGHYENRMNLIKKLKEIKSGHRDNFFGDCADTLV